MKVDAHTPCPACPIQVRQLYASAQIVLELLTQVVDGDVLSQEIDRTLVDAAADLHVALKQLAPLIEAHDANQLHALSLDPALLEARAPSWPT